MPSLPIDKSYGLFGSQRLLLLFMFSFLPIQLTPPGFGEFANDSSIWGCAPAGCSAEHQVDISPAKQELPQAPIGLSHQPAPWVAGMIALTAALHRRVRAR
ncbi:hypothetical protein SGGMMB4_00884 [Sodalis glossinidius str. 'morsitans']|uniref:Uncharacterized protein n=1 Tax=Sodalis glossinidius (strain morsitans) TaxID=343509 RepID=A0A193QFR5_SODGM|nr:hypothetical protein SGGMMB4_00884 [Sodalis glossinidius str. 'morsitans']